MAIPTCLPGISFRDIADLNLFVPVKYKKRLGFGARNFIILKSQRRLFLSSTVCKHHAASRHSWALGQSARRWSGLSMGCTEWKVRKVLSSWWHRISPPWRPPYVWLFYYISQCPLTKLKMLPVTQSILTYIGCPVTHEPPWGRGHGLNQLNFLRAQFDAW